MSTPRYRLPAEWEPHKSTILCWPHQKADWPGKFMPIPWVYTEIIKNIASSDELVRIIVQSAQDKTKAQRCLKRADVALENIEFIVTQTDRGWMRDSSPCFVKQGPETLAVQFTFNGWAKYDNWQFDRHIPATLSQAMRVDLREAIYNERMVVLEGGAIDTNGCGTLLTTMECLLDKTTQVRNPGFSKSDYATVFARYLGITNVIWLNRGIAGDDTHGHVDDLCRFVNRDTVVLCREKNQTDDNYRLLEENFERLQDARLEDGAKLNIVSLPMPRPVVFEGLRLPASYANFYIANRSVLAPTFNDPNDRIALTILQDLFPDRQVVGIHAVDLVWGLGTIHCLSHEEPM
ncbi:MAG: agmatine deiminase family protein [Desulfobulbaceae bacterium]|nr:agmatine deiminase family protein [Desulfobulbaceae bacterium]